MFVSTESYTLEDSELEEINNYISTIELPFKENYLQIAFESFNLSYDTPIKELSFLSLMISLESLLNPSDNRELRYRISRNIAVLLGKDKKDSERIFSETKKFYDMR